MARLSTILANPSDSVTLTDEEIASWSPASLRTKLAQARASDDPDLVDRVLSWSARHGNQAAWAAAVETRSNMGAWVFSCPNWLTGSLNLATQSGSLKTVRQLIRTALRHLPKQTWDGLLDGLLRSTAARGEEVAMTTWLALGADPKANQATALCNAAYFNHWPVVLRLLPVSGTPDSSAVGQMLSKMLAAGRDDILAQCQNHWEPATYATGLMHAAIRASSAPHLAQALAAMAPEDRAFQVSQRLTSVVSQPALLEQMVPHCTSLQVLAKTFWLAMSNPATDAQEVLLPHVNWGVVWKSAPADQVARERAARLGPPDLQRKWVTRYRLPGLEAYLIAQDRAATAQEKTHASPSRSRARP